MTEHETLHWINEKIGHKPIFEFEWEGRMWTINRYLRGCDPVWNPIFADVREIIFTTEFMDKFKDFIDEKCMNITKWWNTSFLGRPDINEWLMDNLRRPVDYLYNLIK